MAALLNSLYFITVLFALCESSALRADNAVQTIRQQRFGSSNKYFLYSRAFRQPTEVLLTAEAITNAGIVAADSIVVIIHDHQSNAFNSLNIPLKEAIIQTQDAFKVICVDWSLWANQNINIVDSYVPGVGEGVAAFLNLVTAVVPAERVHIVGFGLGAHIAGISGRLVTTGNIARITGLDPTGRTWDTSAQRLSPASAAYVEVIHTDGFGANAIGTAALLGHVDFFPNGSSTRQPRCTTNACNHDRAWEVYESSILNPGRFSGTRCSNIALMTTNRCVGPPLVMGGLNLESFASGIYRLTTTGVYPY